MPAEKQICGIAASPSVLHAYLERNMEPVAQETMKHHLDSCAICHALWNRYRWDQAKGQPGYQEWLHYLHEKGEPLQDYLDSSHALITQWREQLPQTRAEREQFFRSTPFYLSNLVIWHESGHRPPYVTEALPLLRQLQAQTICDFGCGIGSDGLQFLAAGYEVVFCEFDNPASRFLRWRLQQRQHEAQWIEPGTLHCAGPFDTLWAMDVLDHLTDLQVLIPLLEHCRILCYEQNGHQRTHGETSFHLAHSPEALQTLWTAAGFQHVETGPFLTVWGKP